MAGLALPYPPQFDPDSDPTSTAIRWSEWRESLDIYFIAAAVTDDKQKRALLLHLGGPSLQKVFKGLEETGDDFDSAVRALDAHFKFFTCIRNHELNRANIEHSP